MKIFRTVAAVVLIMSIFSFIGFFMGALLNNPVVGVILGVLISGIACIIYTIGNIIDNIKNQ